MLQKPQKLHPHKKICFNSNMTASIDTKTASQLHTTTASTAKTTVLTAIITASTSTTAASKKVSRLIQQQRKHDCYNGFSNCSISPS
jgi:hypothetical protein